jgi:type I restriction enzyme M protein
MTDTQYITKTKQLIDSLKNVCANYGLGNDGNEFKIITQVFLYKFLNDKFTYTSKLNNEVLAKADDFYEALYAMKEDDFEFLLMANGENELHFKPDYLISYLYQNQNQDNFSKLFDNTLKAISSENVERFSVKSSSGAKDLMFDELSQFISDSTQRDDFCRALINKLFEFSFEDMFGQKYDFFATIFEYLIKDYNTDSGGKYAEYYTPHAVARIMAAIMVNEPVNNVTCYDPSAGSGTLLMNIAHAIGEDKCSIFSEDISQKSSNMLRLNLILNNLSLSIPNIVKTNTILHPQHRDEKFDYVVSNPPFKLDFSDYHKDLDSKINNERFFAGLPNVPKAKKESMAIYLLFIQHIMFSLSAKGKAAIVVPTGFITAQSGIEKKIREAMVNRNMLRGVVSMPSNIFASTGTNVSVLFLDSAHQGDKVMLVDASKLGETIKEGKNQRTVLTPIEEQKIIDAFNLLKTEEDFAVQVSHAQIKDKNYSFSAGQYFDVKIDYIDITVDDFKAKMQDFESNLTSLFTEGYSLDNEIKNQLKGLKYE